MKTTVMKMKSLSILLAMIMLLGMIPVSIFAADTTPSYVALGDSISTGYGLANKTTQGFTYLLADELGYELTNLAVDGNTAAGILAQLQQQQVQNAVAGADLITITAGGNDLMAVLYQAIADQYNNEQSNDADKISADEVVDIFTSADPRKMNLLNYAMGLLNKSSDIYLIDDAAFANAVNAYIGVINQIMDRIYALNPDATVIIETQYNPYVEFNGASYTIIIFNVDLTPIYE